jgi:hypothetical protein
MNTADRSNAMQTILTKHQVKTYGPKPITGWGKGMLIKAEVRFDDQCGNGHNTFAITGEIYKPGRRDCEACGMLHKEIAEHFPELAPFIKWHLTSTDGPMHYVANTLYWLGYDTQWCDGRHGSPPSLEYARSTAVWPDMPEDMLETSKKYTQEKITTLLLARQEKLLQEFREAMELLGFTY